MNETRKQEILEKLAGGNRLLLEGLARSAKKAPVDTALGTLAAVRLKAGVGKDAVKAAIKAYKEGKRGKSLQRAVDFEVGASRDARIKKLRQKTPSAGPGASDTDHMVASLKGLRKSRGRKHEAPGFMEG